MRNRIADSLGFSPCQPAEVADIVVTVMSQRVDCRRDHIVVGIGEQSSKNRHAFLGERANATSIGSADLSEHVGANLPLGRSNSSASGSCLLEHLSLRPLMKKPDRPPVLV